MAIEPNAVMILLALQLAAFGWRLAREIDGREEHPFPWVPVPAKPHRIAGFPWKPCDAWVPAVWHRSWWWTITLTNR